MRRIGEVAAATGLTVRTLHHYDEIGLLAPSGRSDAGYRLYAEAASRGALRRRLVRLLGALDGADGAAADLFLEAIEGMTMSERYYTPEQLAQLEQRRDALGEEGMRKAEADWAALIAEAEELRASGAAPTDPRTQALAARWAALVEQFTGGDPGLHASLNTMYTTEGAQRASRGALSPELFAWMGDAMAARPG